MPPKFDLKELKIRRFDPSTIAPDAIICMVGRRRSGKSVAVKAIMNEFKDIPRGIVMSGTEHVNKFFGEFIPETYIYPEYDSALLEKVFKMQARRIRKDGGKKGLHNSFFLIMDDLLSDAKSWKSDRWVRELLMNGRHMGLFTCITLQYCMGIPPDLRTNIDFSFLFHETIRANRKRLWENFAGVIPDFAAFETLLNATTEDHNCLVINNCTTSNKLEDILFYWKAPNDLPKFRVGSPSYWKFHDERFNSKEDDSDDDDPLSNAKKIIDQYGKETAVKVILRSRKGPHS
jgi:hypothetical protein